MNEQSKSLNGWGNAFLFTAVILLVVGLIAWFMGEGTYLMTIAFPFLIGSPLFKGLAVLVKNAEDEIDRRERDELGDSYPCDDNRD